MTISIHAPREGSDKANAASLVRLLIFQSTLPVRGATTGPTGGLCRQPYFNPRSP